MAEMTEVWVYETMDPTLETMMTRWTAEGLRVLKIGRSTLRIVLRNLAVVTMH